MKAYKISMKAQLEGHDCFCCDYGSCTPDEIIYFSLIVVDKTAGKARYRAAKYINDEYDMSDHVCIWDLMAWSNVSRTKRKYNYHNHHVRILNYEADDSEVLSDEDFYFGFNQCTTSPTV